MTDEKLDHILRQALAPKIDDSEIQIQRKGKEKKMNLKKTLIGGFAVCAALALVVTGYGRWVKPGGTNDVGTAWESDSTKQNENADASTKQESANFFVITANAAELPEGVMSGDVMSLSNFSAGYGSPDYLDQRFVISGDNIEKIRITTDKCNIYTAVPVFRGDSDFENAQNAGFGTADYYEPIYVGEPEEEGHIDHYENLHIVGQSYEGDYDETMCYGMSVPEELWSTDDDIKLGFYEDVDQVDGATITIAVTFTDGSMEEHHYRLSTGKIFVPSNEDGILEWDNLTRFVTSDEEPYTYGYLMEKID